MKQKKVSMLVIVFVGMLQLTANARDLIWAKTKNTYWTDANWRISGTTESVKMEAGDNVRIDDTISTYPTILIDMRVNPGSVVVDSTVDRTFSFQGATTGFGSGVVSIEKYGTGMLTFLQKASWGGVSGDNLNVCPIDIYGGTLVSGIRANYNTFGDCRVPFTVTVHSGGRFWIRHHCSTGICTGTTDSDNSGNINVTVYTNGVFEAYSDNESACNPIGWLTLDGGTFRYGAAASWTMGMIEVRRGMRFRGTVPYVFDYDSTRTRNDSSPCQSISLRPHKDKAAVGDRLIEFDVADIVPGDAADVTFNIPIVHQQEYAQTCNVGIRKTGAGRLVLGTNTVTAINSVAAESRAGYCFDGDVRIDEGVLDLASSTAINPFPVREIFVSTNAELRLSNMRGLNFYHTYAANVPSNTGDVSVVVSHGKLSIPDANPGFAYLGSLTLDHAIFEPQPTGDSGWGKLFLGKLVKIVDDEPIEWSRATFGKVNLYPEVFGGTTFDIISSGGSETWDMLLSCQIGDHRDFNYGTRPGALVKRGTGTLALDYIGNTFQGDIQVLEGTLMVGTNIAARTNTKAASLLGDLTQTRTFFVNTNAVLTFNSRGVLPDYNNVTNDFSMPITMHVCGTLKFESGNTINPIPNITIENGRIEYGEMGGGGFGLFKIMDTFKVIGTEPFTMSADSRYGDQWVALNGYPATTFDIADVTESPTADATFETPLIAMTTWIKAGRLDVDVGFVKRGAGTFRIAAPKAIAKNTTVDITPNGMIDVQNGCLQVDGWLGNARRISVGEGAFIAGTGTVSNVSLDAGAGFRAKAGQPVPLTITGDLVLPETGVVEVFTDGAPSVGSSQKIKLATVSGQITAPANLNGWTVKVDGKVYDQSLRITRNTLSVLGGGFIISIK